MTKSENEWFIQVPWGRICVVAWGSCLDPPVLLCHGGMDSAASFRPLVQLLPKNFYYIGMEFPGLGLSDRFPPGLMINAYDLVYCVDAVVRHFRWESFAFIGHSMGSYVGKLYNVSCPGMISKLIELDPINVVAIEPDMFSMWYKHFFTEYYDNIDKYNVPKGKAPKITWNKAIETLQKVRGLPKDAAKATLLRWTEPLPDGYVRYTYDQRMRILSAPCFSLEHIRNIFTSTKTPTLDIVANESYKKGLFRNTTFLLEEYNYPNKNFRCRRVEGNHDAHIITPGVVAMYVCQFLLYGLEGLDSNAKL